VAVLVPEKLRDSPLDAPGIELGLTAEEVVTLVREGRRRA
jgi:hypothetical protein